MRDLRIAMLYPTSCPHSSHTYIKNITQELRILGVDVMLFSIKEPIPDYVDLYWDPRAGRSGPFRGFKKINKPFVVTFHGAANVALPLTECFGKSPGNILYGLHNRAKTLYGWRSFGGYSAVITVSTYAKKELQKKLGVNEEMIVSIHHGVDHNLFEPSQNESKSDAYFLHVSSYQPKKNLNRLFAAFHLIFQDDSTRLIAVIPGYPKDKAGTGIEIIRRPFSHEQLAPLYRDAVEFVFPSLHETFGHPIVEAMASGCPVITSNVTACPEVAEDAALLVNPRSIKEIASAMQRLLTDIELRRNLREKAIERANNFTWKRSAEAHLKVFETVLSDNKGIRDL